MGNSRGDCVVEELLNEHVRGLSPSATVAINDRSNLLQRQGKPVFKLGLGQSPFPVPDVVVDALKEHAGEKDYLPVQGLGRLREAVAEHHRCTFGITCRPEDVLIGPGSKELMFLLQLVYRGELCIPTPTWVSYVPQARIIGRPVRFIPTTSNQNWHLNAERLEQMGDERGGYGRLLVLTYPSNPAGTTIPEADLRDIAEIARRKRVVVLSDEIYGKLHHTGQHRSIVPHYPEGTIFSGGLSKWCGAGGWRLGLFVFPKCLGWLREAMAAVATETFTSSCAPVQHAAIRAFEGGAQIDAYLNNARRIVRAIGDRLTRRLSHAGADVRAPEGGFYLFPDFSPFRERLAARGIRTSADLCRRLLEDTGVAVLPGSDFGQPAEQLTIRIAYVDFDGQKALTAASRYPARERLDDTFVHEHCRRVVEAVERICRWLESECLTVDDVGNRRSR